MERDTCSVLSGYLLEENHQVTVVDNFLYESNTLASYCNNKNFKIINKDCRDLDGLEKEIKNSDIIIPLATGWSATLQGQKRRCTSYKL